MDVSTLAREYRVTLADRFDALSPEQWDMDSWCSGWRVRDVLAHLVHLAESTQRSMARDVLSHGGRPTRALQQIARERGEGAVPDLAERLRRGADSRFRVFGAPRAVILGEVLVHSEDALRPLGSSIGARPSDARQVLDLYRRIGPFAFRTKRLKTVRLVATDDDWSAGNGPEVKGRAIDLLLLLANRREVLPSLSGPGVAAV